MWTIIVEEIGFQTITISKAKAFATVVHHSHFVPCKNSHFLIPSLIQYHYVSSDVTPIIPSAPSYLQSRFSPENVTVNITSQALSVFHYQDDPAPLPEDQTLYPSGAVVPGLRGAEPVYFEGPAFVKEPHEYKYEARRERPCRAGGVVGLVAAAAATRSGSWESS